MNTDDKILTKVRALLNQAEKTTFESEADAFRAKANELIAQYEIDEASLWAGDIGKQRDIVRITRTIESPYTIDKAGLWYSVGRVFGVQMVSHYNHYNGKKGIKFLEMWGTQTALDITEFLVTSLMVQAANQIGNVKAEVGPKQRSYFEPSTRALRIAWLAGFFDRSAARIREAHRVVSEAYQGVDNPAALVLVDDAKRSREALEKVYPKLGSSPARKLNSQGYAMGRAAGNHSDIGATRIGGSRKALNA